MQQCRSGRLGQALLYLLHRDLKEESCSTWAPFFKYFWQPSATTHDVRLRKKRKNQDPGQIYSASVQFWASLRAMLLLEGQFSLTAHSCVLSMSNSSRLRAACNTEQNTWNYTPRSSSQPAPKQYFWKKKQQEKWTNLHLKAALYPCLTDRADKPQGYSLLKPNETERRDGKGQHSGTCSTHTA